ncbi:hypothetical protein [Merdimmobilis hominis]|uniref:hypothetical protein n=1 Tax=Merdimmobilis hominis TaxID=2897707 RepID=UPI0008F8EDC0|nr:hypothetical protein [Merdimmobilis hominis]
MKKRANRILSAILAAMVVVTMSGMTVFAEEVSSAPVAPEEGSSSSAPATPEGEDASSSAPTVPEEENSSSTPTAPEGEDASSSTPTAPEGEDASSSTPEVPGESSSSTPTAPQEQVPAQPLTPAAPAPQETGIAIDGKYYNSIADAIKEGDGKTISITKDISEDVVIPEKTTITLDIASGITLKNTSSHTIENHGTLTVTGSGTVENTTGSRAALANYPGATATLKGCTFTGNTWYVIKNLGTLTMSGADLVQEHAGSSAIDNGFVGSSGGDGDLGVRPPVDNTIALTITGGTFSGGMNTVKNDDYGVLTIEDGTFENTDGPAVLNWNKATITGGTFTVNNASKSVLANGYIDENADKGQMTVTGGTFTAANNGEGSLFGYGVVTSDINADQPKGGHLNITGGTFNGSTATKPEAPHAPSISGGTFNKEVDAKYLVPGYECRKSGDKFVVVSADDDVKVDPTPSTPTDEVTIPSGATEEEKKAIEEAKNDLTSRDNPAATTAPTGLETVVIPEEAKKAAEEQNAAEIKVVISTVVEEVGTKEVKNEDGTVSVVVTSVQFDVEPKWVVGNTSGLISNLNGNTITFRLPVPSSVTAKYAKVEHKGDKTQYVDILSEGGAKYVELSATHFSPFTLTFTDSKPSSGGSSGHSGGSYQDKVDDFWQDVKDQISESKDGDTIKIDAKSYENMPWTVMELLGKHNVTLVIEWDGGDTITIPAGKAQSTEGSRLYWPLSSLAELYKGQQPSEDKPGTTPEQPSEPDKSNPSTGDAYPMAALITALAAVSVAGATFSRKRR